jgi:protein-disulfide isomerase
MKRQYIFGLIGLILAGGAAWGVVGSINQDDSTANRSTTEVTVETNTNSTVKKGSESSIPKLIIGSPAARLTMVEYSDFQCPICRRYFEGAYPEIVANYLETGKMNIEFRVETHIGHESELAGEGAYCANDQEKFKAYHDVIYPRQRGINSGAFSQDNLKLIAGQIGLDQAKFGDCLEGHVYRAAVQASHAESKTRITGTPTFFIGERKIVGAQPFEAFKAVIESEL